MFAIQQKIATFYQDVTPTITQNQNLDLFFEQITIAMQTANLDEQHNEYLIFYQDIITFKQNNSNWKTNENFPSLNDPEYAHLKYNFFAGLHYLTHGNIDEKNIKWIIRKYTTIFVEALG